ncbi:rhomboid family intramembrane serine protease [Candidatus Micrarchaeota archaeon]|nr:rhomboid family intramembrane serine protease [Candidatus Micrarchaeota archaeon]
MIWLYLLAATTAVFLLELAFFKPMLAWFSFIPALAFTEPWRWVTALFLHANFIHLAFNMFALFMFGPYLEGKIGSKNFLAAYLAAGLAGNLFYFLTADPLVAAIGASGAVYGILGALALLEPNLGVLVFFFPMPMWLAAIFWVLIEFVSTANPSSGIANWAHLGGIFAGLGFAYLIKNKVIPQEEFPEYY